ncbi:MAG: putative NADH-flavin reductase [Homoserinimonas sp.]|jgi:uncharacterized protein YbjT (DUF2867 family)|nr:putative NADH-flavin reductase [Homoserinimonas sp.]
MSRIVIIGGHGKVALHLAGILSGDGHQVTSLFRNPEHADEVAEMGARPVTADVESLSTDDMAQLLKGHDAVVWSAGAGGGDPDRTYAVDQDAAIRSMDAAARAGVDRYVMVSYMGASINHRIPPEHAMFAYAEAKSTADEYLRGSALSWTILGPSALTLDAGTNKIAVGDNLKDGQVPRQDVARVIAAVLGRPETAGRTIQFTHGDTPIEEAIR